MLPSLTAVQFHRFLTSGRTSPALCACEDQAGTYVGEYVVKLQATVHTSGLLNELVASKLANHFGLPIPDAALVVIQPDLARQIALMEPSHAAAVRGSVGLNFGSRYIRASSPWPVDKPIPLAMWQRATDIFAFDALIQNPDRRYENQNLLVVGDDLLIFDHEQAFSFQLALAPSVTPWDLADQPYLANHVFYRRLRGREVHFAPFTESLQRLSPDTLAGLVADVPLGWNNNNVHRVVRHLLAVAGHGEGFAEALRRFLV